MLKEPPTGYDRKNYIKYFDDLREGRLSAPKTFKDGHGYYADHFDTMVRVFSFTEIPNKKYDVNINPRPLGFPFAGENYAYPEAKWQEREEIFKRHRDLTLGLIYFVQNDPEIPEAHRMMARKYHLPVDEFADNEHFPWQFYIREARRLKGHYTLNEKDVTLQGTAARTTVFYDTIITGEFPIDSFPVSKESSRDKKVLEGYIGMLEIAPYQVPYRILVPEKIRGLIVPVAASTTHVAFSTIRMEPLWMGIGQVAGIAAHMANEMKVEIKDVPIHQLQKELIEKRQILTFFKDIERDDRAFNAVQFLGTRGFFDSYYAKTKEPLCVQDLNLWIARFNDYLRVQLSTLNDHKEQTVSISTFAKVIQPLQASDKNMSTDAWLYNPRDQSLPVLCGEACMAMYPLFFSEAEKLVEKINK